MFSGNFKNTKFSYALRKKSYKINCSFEIKDSLLSFIITKIFFINSNKLKDTITFKRFFMPKNNKISKKNQLFTKIHSSLCIYVYFEDSILVNF